MKIRLAALVAVTAATLAGFSLVGCSDPAPAPAAPTPVASPYANVRISLILVAMTGQRKPPMNHTKEQCLAIATSVLHDVQGGRDFLDAASRLSDLVDKDGKPTTNCGEPGSFEGAPLERFPPPIRDVVLQTAVGAVHPEPIFVESAGYFVLRRVK